MCLTPCPSASGRRSSSAAFVARVSRPALAARRSRPSMAIVCQPNADQRHERVRVVPASAGSGRPFVDDAHGCRASDSGDVAASHGPSRFRRSPMRTCGVGADAARVERDADAGAALPSDPVATSTQRRGQVSAFESDVILRRFSRSARETRRPPRRVEQRGMAFDSTKRSASGCCGRRINRISAKNSGGDLRGGHARRRMTDGFDVVGPIDPQLRAMLWRTSIDEDMNSRPVYCMDTRLVTRTASCSL